MARTKKLESFENSLAELEKIVESMEQGDIPLEKALESFEKGIKLARTCQKTLTEAEQKVRILLEQNGKQTLEEFSNDPS
ncbi:MAG: exodeoxyribonuclease VII small subunit [Gammaproteobacteria bacterium]|nr:exodeoxyribonuclease VII small subunit [Gammaproteobacteria bacterium]